MYLNIRRLNLYFMTFYIMNFKIGHGYDVHRLESNRKFTIGGIEIKHHKGVIGHSDADVVIHALCDAMLGALSLDDIGSHFPDNDKKYKNIDSKILLGKVTELCNKNGYRLSNADITILLQEPKISKYKTKMIKVLSEVLNVDYSKISVKATTTQGLGFIGREAGGAAQCDVFI